MHICVALVKKLNRLQPPRFFSTHFVMAGTVSVVGNAAPDIASYALHAGMTAHISSVSSGEISFFVTTNNVQVAQALCVAVVKVVKFSLIVGLIGGLIGGAIYAGYQLLKPPGGGRHGQEARRSGQ